MGGYEKGEGEMSEFKVGDKVMVRKDLKADTMYGCQRFVDSMEKMLGKEATIDRIRDSGYKLREFAWNWTDEMFEPVTLSTGDMINALMANPGQRYKDDCDRICYVKYGSIIAEPLLDIDEQWTLLPEPPKPVPFMEAAKAKDNGITVRCILQGSSCVYTSNSNPYFADIHGKVVTTNEILRGEWYIEE